MSVPTLEDAVRLHRLGRRAEAATIYSALLRQSPRNFHALYFLGYSFFESGEFEHAIELIGEAVRINPESTDAFYNLGCAYQQLQHHRQAIACFDSALAIKPDLDMAWTNRGAALLAVRQYGDAVVSFDRALRLNPRDVEALSNRGTAWFEMQRFDKAAGDYAEFLEIAPEFPYALGNLALARAYCCDWRFADTDRSHIVSGIRSGKAAISPHGSVLLLDDPEDQLLCAKQWVASHAPAVNPPLALLRDAGHARLRIAYISADFHFHATSMLLAGVLEHHDRERFEIFGISFGPDDQSELRKRVIAGCDRFLDLGSASDAEIARSIADLEIDIAVDLKGFTQHSRPGIFARRPAPIKINYLGHPGTMGAEYVDYVIADEVVIPRNQQRFYTEKVVYLPGSYQANDSLRCIADAVPSREQAGLPGEGFVFCCFNHSCKITQEMFAIWMTLLRNVENSVLWLLAGNDAAVANLKRSAGLAGVEATRLIFAPRAESAAHLARHRLAGLFLDTVPCCAHTTASDALWAGLPLLSIAGSSFAGRVAASLLHAIGLPELVVTSQQDYQALALELARRPALLAELRSKLAAHRSTCPLFDTAAFTKNMEQAYAEIWQRHRRGLPPSGFTVG